MKTQITLRRNPLKSFLYLLLTLLLIVPLFVSCSEKTPDYFSYVSENRRDILTADGDGYTLKIYVLSREVPYAHDGVKRNVETRTELYFTAPEGDKTTTFSFTASGKTESGELSFDRTKNEYVYSSSFDLSGVSSLNVKITYDTTELTFEAKSVKKDGLLTEREILEKVVSAESESVHAHTKKGEFSGEFSLRLIEEDGQYYYVGVIYADGIKSYLIDGTNGKILAKR